MAILLVGGIVTTGRSHSDAPAMKLHEGGLAPAYQAIADATTAACMQKNSGVQWVDPWGAGQTREDHCHFVGYMAGFMQMKHDHPEAF